MIDHEEHLGTAVDVDDGHELDEGRDVAMGPTELRFPPLFRR